MLAAASELADANHILAAQEVLDAFGHPRVRSPDDPGAFLISRNLAPAQVAATQLGEYLPLSSAEAAATSAAGSAQLQRAWDLWKSELG